MTEGNGRVICGITISADGYSAGLNQTEERPFGDDGGDGWGNKLHAWFAETPEENRAEVDEMTAAKAFIMGATCSARCAASGIGSGTVGGATIRRTMPRSSCSPTMRASRSRWRAAPRTTSSPTELSRH
jgi:hypothetical protein